MSYSNANKETKNGLCKRYVWTTTREKYGGHEHTIYRITRVCTKTYSYNGLTESDAKQCAQDKIAKYTRQKKGWYYSEEKGWQYQNCQTYQAQICPVHDSGHMWHTDIQVNEKDDVYRADSLPENLESLFTWITCDYDE